ncbi:MAG: hypothetical protein Q4C59_05285 [Lachnospiraceae bacterium]|nr:hypothetical protein [Lachnospiraceae bacterium]
MAEMGISFFIFLLAAVIMICIGISQVRNRKPVGFYSGQEPPKEEEVSEVKEWNMKHGAMWIIYGAAVFGVYIAGIFMKGMIHTAALLIVMFGGVICMVWYHHRLEKKYLRQRNGNNI